MAMNEATDHVPFSNRSQDADGANTPRASKMLAVRLWRAGAISIASILAIGFAVQELYVATLRAEMQRKRGALVNRQLVKTRLRESDLLQHYRWIDAPRGILRIPVEMATHLVLAEYANAIPVHAPAPRVDPSPVQGGPKSVQ